jgi:hypothetical protein
MPFSNQLRSDSLPIVEKRDTTSASRAILITLEMRWDCEFAVSLIDP